MRIAIQVTAALMLAGTFTRPAEAQTDFWQNKWFWGANAGALIFRAGGSREAALSAGGHWLITAGRSALYFAYDEMYMTNSSTLLSNGRQVDFDRGNRIQASVMAMPNLNDMQLFLGGGFAIQNVTDARPVGDFATPAQLASTENLIDNLATKAFFLFSGGVQWRWRGNWVVYGQYQFQPATDRFLINSDQHTLQGGLRIALTSSKEAVTAN